jgi:hypothetical protein
VTCLNVTVWKTMKKEAPKLYEVFEERETSNEKCETSNVRGET